MIRLQQISPGEINQEKNMRHKKLQELASWNNVCIIYKQILLNNAVTSTGSGFAPLKSRLPYFLPKWHRRAKSHDKLK